MFNRIWCVLVCLSPLILVSCKPQRIISGTEVKVEEEQAMGLVQVNATAGPCSGVLLNDSWVLTAGHCFLQNTRPQTASISFRMKTAPNDVVTVNRNSDAVYILGHESDGSGKPTSRGYDTAFFHLSGPVTPTPFKQKEIFDNAFALPSGASLRFFGHGLVDYYQVGPPVIPEKESDVYREALLQLTSVLRYDDHFSSGLQGPWPDSLTVAPNSAGQVCAPGDSGGPSFFNDGTGERLTGITIGGDYDCVDHSSATACKATITRIKNCVANRLDKSFTEEIIAAPWNANAITSKFVAAAALHRLEAIYWDVTQTDLIDPGARPWFIAFRGASEMCYDRGYIGGHFTGNTVGTAKWEYVCSGSSVSYMDAFPPDIKASGWNFTTLSTNWAQANRAASTICAKRFPLSVGGHFNGVATLGLSDPSTPPSIIASIGLICYLPPNEKYLIPNTGRIFPRLKPDDYKWSTATQIAGRICAQRGFTTGFMTGLRVEGKLSIVCQK